MRNWKVLKTSSQKLSFIFILSTVSVKGHFIAKKESVEKMSSHEKIVKFRRSHLSVRSNTFIPMYSFTRIYIGIFFTRINHFLHYPVGCFADYLIFILYKRIKLEPRQIKHFLVEPNYCLDLSKINQNVYIGTLWKYKKRKLDFFNSMCQTHLRYKNITSH